ncbi:MAG: hypothetical protein CM1200mP29_12260 [Verrucomicrobiota bacterium]|nr:MAG: hypothetical protein CM1200mP29_12260 [Verrucomicrobiota bacterium]
MTGEAVATSNENLAAPIVSERDRSTERLERFTASLGRPVYFPKLPAAFRIER